MGELISERIRRNARELKLYGLADTADELVDRAEAGKLGYREFLDLVLESEVGVLEGRRYASRLKLSGLPHHKTLDEFDISFQPELDPKRLAELRSLRFVQNKVSSLILGPPGVGKTHLAVGWRWKRSAPATSFATPPSTTSSANCVRLTSSARCATSSPTTSAHTF
jgi:DNA replication protein DnaC